MKVTFNVRVDVATGGQELFRYTAVGVPHVSAARMELNDFVNDNWAGSTVGSATLSEVVD